MSADNSVIRLKDVCTAYEGADRPTLRNVTLSVRAGEFVVIGGPNGAGKTTLLETINGMLPVTHGSASVLGQEVNGDGVMIRRRVGYLIQNFSFDPLTPFSVRDVILMGRYGLIGLLKKPGPGDVAAAREAMTALGITDLADRLIGQLSGGQQQKVLLAQNLARRPEILLLDEPFSNLDIFARESITRILLGLAEAGTTILMVSHAFDDLPDRMIRVLVMSGGSLSLDRECRPGDVSATIRAAGGCCCSA